MEEKFDEEKDFNKINELGYGLSEIAKIDSPEKAISELLTRLGETFQCERVYIFEQNEEGNYDCTGEWLSDETFAKKPLLQNLPKQSVNSYYDYFNRYGKLVVRDIEQFKEQDYDLYKLLKPQNLQSLFCGQLFYDDKDRGFLGIDNPAPEKFDELDAVFEIIKYYAAIQSYRKEMVNRLASNDLSSDTEKDGRVRSIYSEFTNLKAGEPVALIYCQVNFQGENYRDESELTSRMLIYTERVLGSIFHSKNVFSMGRNDFLIVYDDFMDMDIASIKHLVSVTKRTLETMNIYLAAGSVLTESYDNNLFELINQANIEMLRAKREHRNSYVGKYHMQDTLTAFHELIEVIPEKNEYRVLYSEYFRLKAQTGKADALVQDARQSIHPSDYKKYDDFWEYVIYKWYKEKDSTESVVSETVQICKKDNVTVSLKMSVVKFLDVDGQVVYMYYSK